MKKGVLLLVSAIVLMSFSYKPSFTIKGKLDGLADGMVYLKKRGDKGIVTVDSTMSAGGSFELKGEVEYPERLTLIFDRRQVNMFVENTAMTVTGRFDDLKSIKVAGSKTNDEYVAFESKMKEIYTAGSAIDKQLDAAKEAKDEAKVKSLEAQMADLEKQYNEFPKEFFASHTKSFAAPIVLQQLASTMDGEEIESNLKKLSPEVMKTKAATDLAVRAEKLKAVAIGKTAPEFTMNNTEGVAVKLSDVYSKHAYTLIDFWASWCGPCRAENPNVVAVWKDYNAKGFTVLGISLDKDKDRWIEAIGKDQLTWIHLSDLQFWSNAAAQLYSVNSIPANLLVDKNGKIIARNLRGEKLREKMAELLK